MGINPSLQLPLPFQTMSPTVDTSGIASSFMRAYELAQQQSDPYRMLQAAQVVQDMKMKEFVFTKQLDDRQKILEAEELARQAAPTIQSLLQQQKPYEALLALQTESAKNPNLMRAPTWNSLGQTVKTSADIFKGMEVTKAQIARDQEAARHNQVIENRPYAATSEFNEWQKARDAYETAVKNGADAEAVRKLKSDFDYWEAKTAQRGETVEMTDAAGNVVRFTKGGSGRQGEGTGPTQAVTTEIQKKIAANNQSLSLIQESLAEISPETVGPRGVANEFLETTGNIIAPGSVGTAATDARQKFRITAQNLFSSLKADAQINKLEGAAMQEIGDITKLKESDATARKKYSILQDLTALKSVLLYHELGKPAPDDVLRVMSPEQVARAWKRGNITDTEVERWNELVQLVK